MSRIDRFKSVNKAISVLRCFDPQNLELSASEISKKVGIHRVTAYRLLETLLREGVLEKNDNTGKYRIGPELYILGNLYLMSTDLLKAAEPVIKTLNDLTGETVNLGIFDKGNVTIVLQEESTYAFKFSLHVGSILPAYAPAIGKAFLGELREEEIKEIYPEESLQQLTKKTVTSRTALIEELRWIKKTGVSFNHEEAYVGVEGIGTVVRDVSGQVVAAISISVPVFRIDEVIRKQLAVLVRMGAGLISYRLGYHSQDNSIRDIAQLRSWFKQNQADAVTLLD